MVLKPDVYITEQALGNLCTWIGPTSTVCSQEEQTLTGAQMRTIIQKGKATFKHHPVGIRVMTTNKDFFGPPNDPELRLGQGEPHLDQHCLILSISFP